MTTYEHYVTAWIGSFGTFQELEMYVNPTYTDDGEREDPPFERDFEIRINPDGHEAEFLGTVTDQSLAAALDQFSYVDQFKGDLERDLQIAALPGYTSLFLTYDYEGEIHVRRSECMSFIGTYRYHPSA